MTAADIFPRCFETLITNSTGANSELARLAMPILATQVSQAFIPRVLRGFLPLGAALGPAVEDRHGTLAATSMCEFWQMMCQARMQAPLRPARSKPRRSAPPLSAQGEIEARSFRRLSERHSCSDDAVSDKRLHKLSSVLYRADHVICASGVPPRGRRIVRFASCSQPRGRS